MPKEKEDRYRARFPEDYAGKLRWMVGHPRHKEKVRVAAPSKQAAVLAASIAWKENWTYIDFYADCDVAEDR